MFKPRRILFLLSFVFLIGIGIALAGDCAYPEDCQATTGYLSVVSVLGGIAALGAGLLFRFQPGSREWQILHPGGPDPVSPPIATTTVGGTAATQGLVSLPDNIQVVYQPDIRPFFAPEFAQRLSQAISEMNDQGIVPAVSGAFRTAADEEVLRNARKAGDPNYPVAEDISLHQAGYAIDFSQHQDNLDTIREIMTRHGFVWGGAWSDPIHFEINPFGDKGGRGSEERSQYLERVKPVADAAENTYKHR
jgi:hypothetical protein